MDWTRVIRRLLRWTAGLAGTLYAFILVLDPYQNVPFAPDLPRAPVATNQRFSYPAIARDARFDALVMGTSTTRLLDPARLGALTDARVANLAMNSATAYEQARMFDLFVRHHPALRYVVLGVDEAWCMLDDAPDPYTFRAFPEWMYDDNPWNDLGYLFNDKALEDAVRMLELLLGAREPKYRRDGYSDFTADFGPRSAAAVRRRLYGAAGPQAVADAAVVPVPGPPGWRFGALAKLPALLGAAPAGTRIVVIFPPFHARQVAGHAGRLAACKGRMLEHTAAIPRLSVLDYMFVSPLTRDDDNYWDLLHFTRAVAERIEHDVAQVLDGGTPSAPDVRVLR
ncbi:MAG: hypothetical protein RLW62_10135 [Gammaproteobacteria bacterium]